MGLHHDHSGSRKGEASGRTATKADGVALRGTPLLRATVRYCPDDDGVETMGV
jgi:hypothetical protein